MNIEKILTRARLAGFNCKVGMSDAGPTVTIKVPTKDLSICGLVPIDDESDDRFADYLIAEAEEARWLTEEELRVKSLYNE